jgi:acyl carrier protein
MIERADTDLRAVVLDALLSVAPDIDPGTLDATREFRDQFDFDSMDYLSFATALHARLGVDVPEADYSRLGTLDGCVRYVAAALRNAQP